MACTEAQRAANRENARKSTGPKTEAGKAASRRNALKHGLSGEGKVLTPELSQSLENARREFETALRPIDAYERQLVDEIALASARMRITPVLEETSTETNRLRDLENFDTERELKAVRIGARISRDPALAQTELKGFSAGCEWLRDRWLALDAALDADDAPAWSKEQLSKSQDLLGIPIEERHLAARSRWLAEQNRLINEGDAAARAALRAFIAGEIARLEEAADRLTNGIEQYMYNNLATYSRFDFSREVQSIRRLELDASRRFHRNLKILETRRGGRLWAAPAPAPSETPAPATPAPAPAPAPQPQPQPQAKPQPTPPAPAPRPANAPKASGPRRALAATAANSGPSPRAIANLERMMGLDNPRPLLDSILRAAG